MSTGMNTTAATVHSAADVRALTDRPALTAALRWVSEFLTQPHPGLGRPGAVCPYVVGALRADTIWLSEVEGAVRTAAAVDRTILGYRTVFRELLDRSTASGAGAALVVVFPHLGADAPGLLGGLLQRVKLDLVRDGMMLGPVYPGNETPGAHDTAFRPMRGPVPLVALRTIMETDLPFLDRATDPPRLRVRYVREYLRHLGDTLPAHRLAAARTTLARLGEASA